MLLLSSWLRLKAETHEEYMAHITHLRTTDMVGIRSLLTELTEWYPKKTMPPVYGRPRKEKLAFQFIVRCAWLVHQEEMAQ